MRAACAAKRWLARNAADVKLIRAKYEEALACASLVTCLPALEDASLWLCPLTRDDLWWLLEALAKCPRLTALDLSIDCFEAGEDDGDLHWPFPYAPSFAKLSSLTKLALAFHEEEPCTLADVVGALVPLTGLAELSLRLFQPAVVPAALGRFKGLQALALWDFSPCVMEAGCLDLPNLLSLDLDGCNFEEGAQMLPGLIALQRLTCMEITGSEGPRFFDPQLVQLPGLQRLVLSCENDYDTGDDDVGIGAPARLLRLPADMGLLSLSLLHLDISGLRLAHFPLALTQLVALEELDAGENDFVELPAGIVALSRLKELKLGGIEERPLNAVALGDLSSFPALCKLTFPFCEVKLCMSVLGGAARHKSLVSIYFDHAVFTL